MQQHEQQLEGLPQQARNTIKRHVGDGQINSVERKKEDDRTVYKVEYRAKDGSMHELKVDQQGQLVEREREGQD